MKSSLLSLLIVLLLYPACAPACSSAIVSARASADGRPFFWKQRDTEYLENAMRRFQGERFEFSGVVNADSTAAEQIWMGSNTAGFAIMNTLSYNLDYPAYEGKMREGGKVMMRALGSCRTCADFEALLDGCSGERGVEVNFGVIDAEGGAAFYETTPYSYRKFDANDPLAAPSGYLIRTNFSQTGDMSRGYGYIRHKTVADLFHARYAETQDISVEYLLFDVARSLKHSLREMDLRDGPLPRDSRDKTFLPFNDLLARYYTASAMIVQGVAEAEDPALTTMWTILGFPLTTPVFPVWAAGGALPEFCDFDCDSLPYLSESTLRLKRRCYPIPRGSGVNYLDLAVLLNEAGDGLLDQVLALDRLTFAETQDLLAALREDGFSAKKTRKHSRRTEARIRSYFDAVSN